MQDSPFNLWSALQTLSLCDTPHVAASCFANLKMQHLRCLKLSYMYGQDTTGIAATLADGRLPALEELELSLGIRSTNDLEHLARGQWPLLKRLKLGRHHKVPKTQVYSETPLDPLADCNWPLLECLCARRWSIWLGQATGEQKWPNLESIDAAYVTGHQGAMYAHLKHIEVEADFPACLMGVLDMHLPSLEHLHIEMDSAHGGFLDMAQIVHSGPWPHLTSLCIDGYQLGWCPMTPVQCTDWRHLKELDLSYNCINAEAVRCLATCNWPCLEELGLVNNDLDHDDMSHLIRAKWPCLHTLYLSENRLCNVAMQVLIQGNWPKFVSLFLASVHIDLVGLRTLLQGHWPELVELSLEGTDIEVGDALKLYSDAACVESCVFGHLLQEYCEFHSGKIAQGSEPEYDASLGIY